MQKSKKFTVVVPALFALSLIAAQSAQAGVSLNISIGKAGDTEAAKVASILAARAGDGEVDSIAQFFKDSASVRYVMNDTEDGRQLMSKILSTPEEGLNAGSYNRFLDRVNWKSDAPLRNRLYQRLRQLDDDFAKFRKQEGSGNKVLKSSDALSPSEAAFLKDRLAQITKDQKLSDLFDHQTDFVSTVPQGYEASREDMTAAKSSSEAPAPVPTSPLVLAPTDTAAPVQAASDAHPVAAAPADPAKVPVDPAPADPAKAPSSDQSSASSDAAAAAKTRSNLQLLNDAGKAFGVLQDPGVKAAEGNLFEVKLGNVKNFFNFVRFSAEDWKSLLGIGSGSDFDATQIKMIRKLNRLMGTLNEYAKTRLTVEMFTQQSPGLYTRLNIATADKTTSFLSGELGEKSYLEARAEAAKKLGMDGIVNKAETRMLQSIDQTRAMGGTASGNGDGIIPKLEADVKTEQETLAKINAQIESTQKDIADLKSQGGSQDQIAAAQKKLMLATTDRDLSTTRVNTAAKQLKSYYWKFIENYEPIEIFKNLRDGKINDDPAQAFDLPDSMVVNDSNYNVWGQIYQRAMNSASDTVVGNEVSDFLKARVGATRSFVRDMNNDTGKLFGTKFSDSQYGSNSRTTHRV